MSTPSILYLHGFASSPQSHKACAVRDWALHQGIHVAAPDLNGAGFATLTMRSQIDIARTALAGLAPPVVGVGSSLGGYLVALMAAGDTGLSGALLMAPAFDFPRRLVRRLGPDKVQQWRADGWLKIYHHSERAEREVGIALVDEAMDLDPMPPVNVPCTIVHGIDDPDVPVELSRLYVRDNATVRLVETRDDHMLHGSIPCVLKELQRLVEGVAGR